MNPLRSTAVEFDPAEAIEMLFDGFGRFFSTLVFSPLVGMVIAATILSAPADAANFRTRNFIIQAPTPALAQQVGEAAEKYRDDLATYWTGRVLAPWPTPCPVRVVAGNLPAQGVTTYNPAPVRDFQMEVIGTPERILDSVLPHEVTHTVLATHFGRPLPRWADEGICTTVEHVSERAKHEAKLREFLASRRGIAMNQLFLLTEYPPDVLPMYAQGYSVCRFLIEQQGPRTFISFLQDYMRRPSWTANVQKHYGYDSLAELQEYWLSWVEAGSGPVEQFVKADDRTRSDGSIASAQPSRAVAPATVLAANSMGENSLVAANDRGRISEQSGGNGWYHRRAAGEELISDAAGPATAAIAPASYVRPTASTNPSAVDRSGVDKAGVDRAGVDKTAADNRSQNNQNSRSNQPVSPWAPPSVLSSGRYSAATPQGESSGRSGTWR